MRRRLLLRRFVGLWGIMSFLGCGSVSEQAPVRPLRGESEERQLLDMLECEPPDKRGAIRLEAIRRYAACMISRGYRAYVEVELIDVQDNLAFPGGLLSFEVQAGAAVTAYDALSVLVACDDRASEAMRNYSTTAKWMRTFISVLTFGVNIHTGTAEKEYLICLAEKGYTAARWFGASR